MCHLHTHSMICETNAEQNMFAVDFLAKKNEMEQLFCCCCCYCCCSGIGKASRQTEDLDSLSTQMNRKTFHNEQTTERPRDTQSERDRERGTEQATR